MQTSVTRKAFLLSLLLLVTGSVWAEWVKIIETSTEAHYIDPATIRKDGNLRKVWSIKDFTQPNEFGWMSARIRNEYDCKGERFRRLSASTHSEPMARGTTIYTNNSEKLDDWTDIPPGTDSEAIMKIVCAK